MNELNNISEKMIQLAEKNCRDILSIAMLHTADKKALIISDANCPLSVTLTEAYKRCLPTATFMDFYSVIPEQITAVFKSLSPADLVVLIQSSSFRLNEFRLRVELFEQSLKVIEHPHLSRMPGVEGIISKAGLFSSAEARFRRGRC